MHFSVLFCAVALTLHAHNAVATKSTKRPITPSVTTPYDPVLPSEEGLKGMPLSHLVKMRPRARAGEEQRRRFRELFGKHPRVAELDPSKLDKSALIQGWTTLRSELRESVNPTTMHHAVKEHLEEHAPQALQDDILAHWAAHSSRFIDRRQEKRARAKMTPEKKLKKIVQRAQRRRDKTPRMTFEDLLDQHDIIPDGRTAAQLERESLAFTDKYPTTSMATVDLRKYLKKHEYDQVEIDAAIGRRRRELKRDHTRKTSANRRLREKEQRGHSSRPAASSQPAKIMPKDWWKTWNL
jgi:hypothetical protein